MDLHIWGVFKTYTNGVQALKDVTLMVPVGRYGSRPGIFSRFKRRI
jgi:hypothetical protein